MLGDGEVSEQISSLGARVFESPRTCCGFIRREAEQLSSESL